MTDLIGGILIVLGAALTALAGIGQVRFGDLMTRMHVATKPSTLGLLLVATGAMFRIQATSAISLLSLTIVLQFVTGPVSAHLVARAAHRHGDWDRAGAVLDELAEIDEL
ncbi:monovalent cation/H(+) antiporter subunit G [Aquihabitans sp. McL0605]|uniref:monovalent cation/H(+) antiporter subunit G n=1 Tax=Aquihabitans sp. McL0605 TaxID=3415671 RepID=UPI003CFAF48F